MGRGTFLHGPFPIKGSWWYTKITIREKYATFLVDFGASVTVLSTRLYDAIKTEGDDLCLATEAKNSDGSILQTHDS